jgi:hypothetical protein
MEIRPGGRMEGSRWEGRLTWENAGFCERSRVEIVLGSVLRCQSALARALTCVRALTRVAE